MYRAEITKSDNKDKKYQAEITDPDGNTKIINFGQRFASDFSIHQDPVRRDRYVQRHSNEHTEGFWLHKDANIYKPSYWSRWLTWG